MDVQTFFLVLPAMLLGARVLGEIAARLSAPPVIGELLAGVLLGPSLLGWAQPTQVIMLLADFGIILLLFEVGLETDVVRLVKTGLKPVIVASAGFAFPFILGYIVSRYLFGQNALVALFIGGTLTATSIGITVRVLGDLRRRHSDEAQVVLGAAVLDDIMGIVLLAFLFQLSRRHEADLSSAGELLLFVALFMLIAPFGAKILVGVIKRFSSVSQIPGLLPTTLVSLVLMCAWLAHAIGAPELLGGFAAGLALSRRFFLPFGALIGEDPGFSATIEGEMKPIINLFTPVFFVVVGLSVNLRAIDWSSGFIWIFSFALLLLAVAGKMAAAFLIRGPKLQRFAIGLAMIPRGEVGLVFAELGRSTGILDNEIHASLVIVIALTTLVTPFAMRWFYARYFPSTPLRGAVPGDAAD